MGANSGGEYFIHSGEEFEEGTGGKTNLKTFERPRGEKNERKGPWDRLVK